MSKFDEIKAQRADLAAEIRSLAEADELTEAQEARWTEVSDEFDAVDAEYKKYEARTARLETAKAVLADDTNVVRSDASADETEETVVRATTRPTTSATKRDPFDLSELRYGADPGTIRAELRGRALDAIEQVRNVSDTHKESATRLVEANENIAEHVLRTGSPQYREEFYEYLRSGRVGESLIGDTESRTALTNAGGAAILPYYLDPTIILTNNGTQNPFREIADVVSITTNVWHGASSAGVTAEWIAEATEVADATPAIAAKSITPYKADAHLIASLEFTDDSNFGSEVVRLLSDARDRLESTAFAVGSGSGQPNGVVTQIATTGTSTGSVVASNTNGTYGVVDVYNLANALPPRYRPNSSWVAEQSVFNLTRQFATGTGPQHAFWTDLGAAIPAQLIGRPTYQSSAMKAAPLSAATSSTDNILVIGDFRAGYKIVDRVGMSIAYNPLVIGSSQRPTGQVSWTAFWRVGGDVVDNNAFRLLQV